MATLKFPFSLESVVPDHNVRARLPYVDIAGVGDTSDDTLSARAPMTTTNTGVLFSDILLGVKQYNNQLILKAIPDEPRVGRPHSAYIAALLNDAGFIEGGDSDLIDRSALQDTFPARCLPTFDIDQISRTQLLLGVPSETLNVLMSANRGRQTYAGILQLLGIPKITAEASKRLGLTHTAITTWERAIKKLKTGHISEKHLPMNNELTAWELISGPNTPLFLFDRTDGASTRKRAPVHDIDTDTQSWVTACRGTVEPGTLFCSNLRDYSERSPLLQRIIVTVGKSTALFMVEGEECMNVHKTQLVCYPSFDIKVDTSSMVYATLGPKKLVVGVAEGQIVAKPTMSVAVPMETEDASASIDSKDDPEDADTGSRSPDYLLSRTLPRITAKLKLRRVDGEGLGAENLQAIEALAVAETQRMRLNGTVEDQEFETPVKPSKNRKKRSRFISDAAVDDEDDDDEDVDEKETKEDRAFIAPEDDEHEEDDECATFKAKRKKKEAAALSQLAFHNKQNQKMDTALHALILRSVSQRSHSPLNTGVGGQWSPAGLAAADKITTPVLKRTVSARMSELSMCETYKRGMSANPPDDSIIKFESTANLHTLFCTLQTCVATGNCGPIVDICERIVACQPGLDIRSNSIRTPIDMLMDAIPRMIGMGLALPCPCVACMYAQALRIQAKHESSALTHIVEIIEHMAQCKSSSDLFTYRLADVSSNRTLQQADNLFVTSNPIGMTFLLSHEQNSRSHCSGTCDSHVDGGWCSFAKVCVLDYKHSKSEDLPFFMSSGIAISRSLTISKIEDVRLLTGCGCIDSKSITRTLTFPQSSKAEAPLLSRGMKNNPIGMPWCTMSILLNVPHAHSTLVYILRNLEAPTATSTGKTSNMLPTEMIDWLLCNADFRTPELSMGPNPPPAEVAVSTPPPLLQTSLSAFLLACLIYVQQSPKQKLTHSKPMIAFHNHTSNWGVLGSLCESRRSTGYPTLFDLLVHNLDVYTSWASANVPILESLPFTNDKEWKDWQKKQYYWIGSIASSILCMTEKEAVMVMGGLHIPMSQLMMNSEKYKTSLQTEGKIRPDSKLWTVFAQYSSEIHTLVSKTQSNFEKWNIMGRRTFLPKESLARPEVVFSNKINMMAALHAKTAYCLIRHSLGPLNCTARDFAAPFENTPTPVHEIVAKVRRLSGSLFTEQNVDVSYACVVTYDHIKDVPMEIPQDVELEQPSNAEDESDPEMDEVEFKSKSSSRRRGSKKPKKPRGKPKKPVPWVGKKPWVSEKKLKWCGWVEMETTPRYIVLGSKGVGDDRDSLSSGYTALFSLPLMYQLLVAEEKKVSDMIVSKTHILSVGQTPVIPDEWFNSTGTTVIDRLAQILRAVLDLNMQSLLRTIRGVVAAIRSFFPADDLDLKDTDDMDTFRQFVKSWVSSKFVSKTKPKKNSTGTTATPGTKKGRKPKTLTHSKPAVAPIEDNKSVDFRHELYETVTCTVEKEKQIKCTWNMNWVECLAQTMSAVFVNFTNRHYCYTVYALGGSSTIPLQMPLHQISNADTSEAWMKEDVPEPKMVVSNIDQDYMQVVLKIGDIREKILLQRIVTKEEEDMKVMTALLPYYTENPLTNIIGAKETGWIASIGKSRAALLNRPPNFSIPKQNISAPLVINSNNLTALVQEFKSQHCVQWSVTLCIAAVSRAISGDATLGFTPDSQKDVDYLMKHGILSSGSSLRDDVPTEAILHILSDLAVARSRSTQRHLTLVNPETFVLAAWTKHFVRNPHINTAQLQAAITLLQTQLGDVFMQRAYQVGAHCNDHTLRHSLHIPDIRPGHSLFVPLHYAARAAAGSVADEMKYFYLNMLCMLLFGAMDVFFCGYSWDAWIFMGHAADRSCIAAFYYLLDFMRWSLKVTGVQGKHPVIANHELWQVWNEERAYMYQQTSLSILPATEIIAPDVTQRDYLYEALLAVTPEIQDETSGKDKKRARAYNHVILIPNIPTDEDRTAWQRAIMASDCKAHVVYADAHHIFKSTMSNIQTFEKVKNPGTSAMKLNLAKGKSTIWVLDPSAFRSLFDAYESLRLDDVQTFVLFGNLTILDPRDCDMVEIGGRSLVSCFSSVRVQFSAPICSFETKAKRNYKNTLQRINPFVFAHITSDNHSQLLCMSSSLLSG